MSELITAREGDRLCRNWIKIGETVFDLVEQLPKRGFAAFLPEMRFNESFCEGSAEHDLWKQCVVERAKERLGRPWPLRKDFKEPASFYRSPLLLKLEEERDLENGVPVGKLPVTHPGEIWRIQVEPGAQRQARASMEKGAWFRAQAQAVEEERATLVLAEMRASSRAHERVNELSGFDEQHRYQCFLDVSTEVLVTYGFKPDKRRSRAHYPVLTKELTDEWDICWVPGEHTMFAGILDKGHFSPRIELRHRRFAARVSNVLLPSDNGQHEGKFLFVRYQDIVPGFSRAYWLFTSLPVLAHHIRAHLELYGLIAPTLEQAVVQWAS